MGQSRPGSEDSGELYAGIVFPLGVKEPALRGRGAGLLLFAGDAPLSGSDKTATNSGREFEYGALAPLTAGGRRTIQVRPPKGIGDIGQFARCANSNVGEANRNGQRDNLIGQDRAILTDEVPIFPPFFGLLRVISASSRSGRGGFFRLQGANVAA